MAGIKQPILDILNLLATIQVTNQDNQTIDLYTSIWNDQLSFEAKNESYSIPKPCAFLEVINPTEYQEMGNYFQNADVVWRVHLAAEMYDAQDGSMEKNLAIFDLRDQIVATLTSYEPTACGPLVKKAEKQEYDHTQVYHYVIDFICNFVDSKGSPWDPFPGQLIETTPPTGLVVIINDEAPDPVPGEFPENVSDVNQSNSPEQIPQ